MTYQVIARKWRPQTFEEVTGQEPITRTLLNAIKHQRLHHAYVFSGARGVGKTTTARLLAKALNCHKSSTPTPTPCRVDDADACASCREITESRSIDVQEIDAASHTGIDNVREVIIGTIGIAPARDRFKIFIIDEVHMLSTNSFNALLKTIEEPPPRVVFIMATTEKHKVPDTILSRSQQFEFRTIATAKILERLRLIANAEKISIGEDALREIARVGEGSMRDAQSAFDQVISFAGDQIKQEDVEQALGIAGVDVLTRVIRGIAENQPAETMAVVDDLVMRGHDLRNFCRDLLAHFRDLLVAKVSGSNELLESAVCERKELERQAALFSESDLVRFFHSLAETENKLRTATQPRYQLEVGLVKLMEMRRLQPLNQLIERISALETRLSTGQPPAPNSPSSTPSSAGGGSRGTATERVTSASAAANSPGAATAVKLAIDPHPVVRAAPDPGLVAATPTLAQVPLA
ncbi:MAG TPA: DNA polymerase III subunit gamma/tau, partial [Pyrinomonadaceae bacterium]|nr:DNA polymerase III subunit gamma/tau [Pyrinomonadaceae bacterium]